MSQDLRLGLKSITLVLSKEKGIARLAGNLRQLWGSVYDRRPTRRGK